VATLLSVTLPVFILIAFGYLVAWRKILSQQAADGLMKFAQTVAVPCLLFKAVSELDFGNEFSTGLLISYYAGSTLNFILGIAGARLIFKRDWSDCVVVGFTATFANAVLMGLPITERAFGNDAILANITIIAVHAPFCYLLGITTMEIVRNKGGSLPALGGNILNAMFRNAIMIGIFLGAALNVSGLSLPLVVTDALDLIIRAALPTALFGLGAVLTRYKPEGDLRLVAYICVLSLVLHPIVAMTLGTRVFDLDETIVRSAVVTAAMAPGLNGYIFATLYGCAIRVAATAVLAGTAVSIVTGTIWLSLY
jgi:malonate transporter